MSGVGEYKYRLPLREFTDDPYMPDPDAILSLSKSNFTDFLDAFHKPEFFSDPCQLIDSLVFEAANQGSSALSLVIPQENIDELVEKVLESTDDEFSLFKSSGQTEGCMNFAIQMINKWVVSDEAKDPTYIRYYDWGAFWDGVAEKYAGVEFGADLIYPRKGEFLWTGIQSDPIGGQSFTLHTNWLRLLDVVSGCIFHPETYFAEKPTDLQVTAGGKRRGRTVWRTRRLLRAIPRRLSATRRARSRV